ncbi:MAG: hypothetical protein SAK29_35745 [Scytonema sp. PMC 1069.18]|nr:hypothetical protein [Scytonema sp. PMC 1069.18]MEC4880985.1 hypothetical protein [Scytonema sp. PMC 1070.18]
MQKSVLSKSLVNSFALVAVGLMGSVNSAFAQQTEIPVCQAPNAGEYLLLVISPTENNRNQLRRALPTQLQTTTCRYLKDTVTRIGGFTSMDDASRWAKYISHVVNLSAIITTRPTTNTAQNVAAVKFNPEQLGNGYAVLVDYYNRPEVANQVRDAVKKDVGFVSYGQRPYLLAVYTNDQKEAYNTLEKLSGQGFSAVLVDSRKVMLLRSSVRL